MSPHPTSNFDNVDDYSSTNWHSAYPTADAQIFPQTKLEMNISFDMHSALSNNGSPPRSPYLMARSAPTTIPIMHPNNSWSNEMFDRGYHHNSYNGMPEEHLLRGIDIPGPPALRESVSPVPSFSDVNHLNGNGAYQTSFSSAYSPNLMTESFPAYDADLGFSTSPTNYDIKPNTSSYSFGSMTTVDSAPSMARTASIMSNESYISKDTEDMFLLEDFSANSSYDNGMAEFDESFSLRPSGPVSKVIKPKPKSSGIPKGRKGRLSDAEREMTAYMRRIKACGACNARRLKVSLN